jgi:pilus assembly protein CpaC
MAAVFFVATVTSGAQAADVKGRSDFQVGRDSVLRIPSNAAFPLSKRLGLGVGRSIVVQSPVPLKDVMVSDPTRLDAVVQSSDRVFLIAKQSGQTNAFFFDEYGQQILTLEVAIGADLSALDEFLSRVIPGSNIHSEIAGKAVVLTGTVRTPMDSNRAAQVAAQFVGANSGSIGAVTQPVNQTTVNTVSNLAAGGPTSTYGQQTQSDTSAPAGQDDPYAEKPVINLLTVEGEEQVMLKVTVAEVQRTLLKQFGINLGAVINSGNFATAVLTDNRFPLTNIAGGLGGIARTGVTAAGATLFSDGNGGVPFTAGSGTPGFSDSGVGTVWRSGNQSVAGALKALERDGLLRTLSEPNLTAVSGEPAKFLAGGEYPIPVVDSLGQVSVVYKEYGVGLAFTPVVMSEGRISLKIESEVSELTQQGAVVLSGIQIPALKKRKANSTVELPSGGSLALAGLLNDDTRQNIDGFPGLKNVPILGTLFRSREYQSEQTELVVIVTPYLVRPTARQELNRPMEGMGDPTDRKANFLGEINRVYGGTSPPPVGDIKGDYGFIVE